MEFLRSCKLSYDCIIADPPDNIGLKYHSYSDNKTDYFGWLIEIIRRSLSLAPVLWLSYYHKHDYNLKGIMHRSFGNTYNVRTFIWRFEFGQYYEKDNPNGHRPIMRISDKHWKPLMEERVPSLREKVGDSRASGKGRVPDDVWDVSRVQGNNLERRAWHPTQHAETIYRRIIRQSLPMIDNKRSGTLLDLFAGSGTCFRCTWDDMLTVGVEIDPFYCEKLREEHGIDTIRTI
jgi:DNA modification methylase